MGFERETLKRYVHRTTVLITMGIVASLATSTTAAADEGPAMLAGDTTPRGTYVRVPEYDAPYEDPSDAPDDVQDELDLQEEPTALPGQGSAYILYLNRCEGGEVISGGWPDDATTNTSSIINGSVNFPPFPYGDASWNQMMEIAKALYAPFNIHVTDQDPGTTPHDEVIVCGSSSQAGFPGAGGVAPFSCGVIDNAISFVFAETMGNDPQSLAEVIGQESAHAWGLEHEYDCRDPMTYLSPCGPKSFLNEDIACGEYNPRACECGGSTQNSYQMIMDIFGPSAPDTQAPVARITYPLDGDVFPPGSNFTIEVDVSDDVEITRVAMYLDGTLMSDDSDAPFGPWPVSDPPEGSYTLSITATDSSGNETTSDAVTFHVTADGAPPPDNGGGGGDDDGGDAGVDGDDGGGADGGGADGGGGDEPYGDTALPADFGLYGDDAGCACATGRDRGAAGWGLVFLALGIGRWRTRRRGRGAR